MESIEGTTVLLDGFVFCLGFRVLVFLLFLEQKCSLKNTRASISRFSSDELSISTFFPTLLKSMENSTCSSRILWLLVRLTHFSHVLDLFPENRQYINLLNFTMSANGLKRVTTKGQFLTTFIEFIKLSTGCGVMVSYTSLHNTMSHYPALPGFETTLIWPSHQGACYKKSNCHCNQSRPLCHSGHLLVLYHFS